MDKKTLEITKFLLDWGSLLKEPPVGGSLTEIYFCFILSDYSRGKERVSWLQFVKALQILNEICDDTLFDCQPKDALRQSWDDPYGCFARIVSIDQLCLGIVLKNLKRGRDGGSHGSGTSSATTGGTFSGSTATGTLGSAGPLLQRLNELIEGRTYSSYNYLGIQQFTRAVLDGDFERTRVDLYAPTTKNAQWQLLDHLLDAECASHKLSRERARLLTPEAPFFECCNKQAHIRMLATLVETPNPRSGLCQLKKGVTDGPGPAKPGMSALLKCIKEHVHYIPIIQTQTDTRLGDCSYLDTCHKMDTCRYVHYAQLMPTGLGSAVAPGAAVVPVASGVGGVAASNDPEEVLRMAIYTPGEPIAAAMFEETPGQWINCDVTKTDLAYVLGDDWGCIVADPSWSIHMNLNYSSMKDDELVNLPLGKLQREGIFLLWVTGRTIEMGRELLGHWGYEVVNQVTWVKTSQLVKTISTGRTGHWLNHSKEHLLVGIKGNPKWLQRGLDPQVLISSTRETSRKPDEIYGIVERLVGSRTKKLEIFGRQHNTRPGWVTVGNQLDGTYLEDEGILKRLGERLSKPTK